jgi:hypothetical protein
MPTDREEKLEERLSVYARSITDFYVPRLAGEKTEFGDGQGKIEQLYGTGFLEAEWKSLRERVLPGKDSNSRPDPSDVDPHGLDYLESILEVTDRRIADLEEERETWIEQKIHWLDSTRNGDASAEETGPPRDVIHSIESQIEEIEEKLSFVRYRHSLAETMLTQIALFDTIQTWEEFAPGMSFPRENDGETLTTAQKRTILMGKVLKFYREEHDQLPDFREKSKLKETFARIDPEFFSCGKKPIADALKATGCWIGTRSGRSAERSREGCLRDIMSRAIDYAERSEWDVSDERIKKIKEGAFDTE